MTSVCPAEDTDYTTIYNTASGCCYAAFDGNADRISSVPYYVEESSRGLEELLTSPLSSYVPSFGNGTSSSSSSSSSSGYGEAQLVSVVDIGLLFASAVALIGSWAGEYLRS